ncbi:hypothetical protein GCM10010151_74140 [Actinoallomurus spadix]|uniref:Uncharacterized protein n=1 Tax=Actinoallomurus spadix TaxID=79912 RepID=A0ABN0XUH7_9ACTN
MSRASVAAGGGDGPTVGHPIGPGAVPRPVGRAEKGTFVCGAVRGGPCVLEKIKTEPGRVHGADPPGRWKR